LPHPDGASEGRETVIERRNRAGPKVPPGMWLEFARRNLR
jgi:hypothetical protein